MKRQFKTNINCGGCIEKVKPHLDSAEIIQEWEVDIQHKDKILKIETDKNVPIEKIINVVEKAGFNIQPRKGGILGKLLK